MLGRLPDRAFLMPTQEFIIDFDDRAVKAKFIARIGSATGKHRITVAPYKPKRSLRANAYWWAAVVPAFQNFMFRKGQWFEPEEIHEFFLQKFASRPVVDPITGEVLSIIGARSSKMNTDEFCEFVNKAKDWMLDRFGVFVPEPEIYHAEKK